MNLHPEPVRVWDLPTRVFHWTLAALVAFAVVSAQIGGLWITWHFRAGYAILALLAFRLVWGFAGGRYARFSSWRLRPAALAAEIRAGEPAAGEPGHGVKGSWAVVAMLCAVSAQAIAGLFAHDELDFAGPLARHVSNETSDTITSLHHLNGNVVVALVALHVSAVLFYLYARRRNLVRPMLTGDKTGIDPALASRDDAALRLRAAIVMAASAAAAWMTFG
jgi:cytochrome b